MYYSNLINSAFYELPERSLPYLCRTSNRVTTNIAFTSFTLWEQSKKFLSLFCCFLFLNYTLRYSLCNIATHLFTTGKNKRETVHKSRTKTSLGNLNTMQVGAWKYVQLTYLFGLSQYFLLAKLGINQTVRLCLPTFTIAHSPKVCNGSVSSLDVLLYATFVISFLRLLKDNKFLSV